MEWESGLALVLTAALAGAINSMAGGGSFLTFPALILTGMSPILANATSTVALWPGTLASFWAYRGDLLEQKRVLPPLLIVSVIGGGIGAAILLKTPEHTFEAMVPYLLLVATVLFTFGPRLSRVLRVKHVSDGMSESARTWAMVGIHLPISLYGGYFGAGIGILMLAMLGLSGLSSIHQMNALKTLLGGAINLIAVIIFIAAGAVVWPQALLMMAAAIVGGYGGAKLAKRLPVKVVRGIVSVIGAAMTVYFFFE